MSIPPKQFDPEDTENIKKELEKSSPGIPCNIYGYLKELKNKIEELESRIQILEQK